MKSLLNCEYDPEAEAMYLRYSNAEVARSQMLDGDDGVVCADFDAEENVVGIELIVVDNETVSTVTRFANERHLGLAGAHFPTAA